MLPRPDSEEHIFQIQNQKTQILIQEMVLRCLNLKFLAI